MINSKKMMALLLLAIATGIEAQKSIFVEFNMCQMGDHQCPYDSECCEFFAPSMQMESKFCVTDDHKKYVKSGQVFKNW